MTHRSMECVCIISNVQSLQFGESLVRYAVFIIIIVVEVVVRSSSSSFTSQAIPGDPIGFP